MWGIARPSILSEHISCGENKHSDFTIHVQKK